MTQVGHSTRRILLPSVVAAAALVLTGCSSGVFESTADDTVYCVDQNNTVVDEKKCEDESQHHGSSGVGTALFFYMIGRYSGGIQPGTRLDPSLSTQRFPTTDQAARQKVGMPATGPVKNGTSASTGKPAGFGSKSGGGSAGKPGGFGGGDGGHAGG